MQTAGASGNSLPSLTRSVKLATPALHPPQLLLLLVEDKQAWECSEVTPLEGCKVRALECSKVWTLKYGAHTDKKQGRCRLTTLGYGTNAWSTHQCWCQFRACFEHCLRHGHRFLSCHGRRLIHLGHGHRLVRLRSSDGHAVGDCDGHTARCSNGREWVTDTDLYRLVAELCGIGMGWITVSRLDCSLDMDEEEEKEEEEKDEAEEEQKEEEERKVLSRGGVMVIMLML